MGLHYFTRQLLEEPNVYKVFTEQNPYEMSHGKKPDLHELHEWGSKVFVKISQTDKLEPRAKLQDG